MDAPSHSQQLRLDDARNRILCPSCGESYSRKYYLTKHRRHCNQLPDSISSDDENFNDHDITVGAVFGQGLQSPQNVIDSDSDPETAFQQELDDFRMRTLSRMRDHRDVSQDEDDDVSDILSDNQSDRSEMDDESENPESDGSDSDDTEPFIDNVIRMCSIFLGDFQAKNNIADGAMNTLIMFIKKLFLRLDRNDIARKFPGQLVSMNKALGINQNDFRTYVVCPTCHKLYDYADCWYVVEGIKRSKRCNFVAFPNHTQQHRRAPCGTQLLTETEVNGTVQLKPMYTYLYRSVRNAFEDFLKRDNYEAACISWKERNIPDGLMADIYDGRIWNRFATSGFFDSMHSYGVILNLDWFNPYKHSSYSIGVLYLINACLPRVERFKIENVIVLGIIPAMKHEPPTNTFVQPFVNEMKDAWEHGWPMKTKSSPHNDVIVKVALICTGADIPAARKLCGFLGHSATAGCSRCKKQFPGGVGEKNFGGFEREQWPPRSADEHRNQCAEVQLQDTKTTRAAKESEHGVRYSVLLELPYYDPIRMCSIDPMHNLYLGTAKHMIQVWKHNGKLSDDDLLKMQSIIDEMVVPSDMGKIPRKIGSKFAKLTADEWKNWALYYSLIALNGILPRADLECWRKFVLACRLFHSRVIRVDDVTKADSLLLSFCLKFEELYSSAFVTPNMHLSCHLREVIMDLGPIYSFWLFPFERYNGILGSRPTNKRGIEPQIMRKMLRQQGTLISPLPDCDGVDCDLHCFVKDHRRPTSCRGTLSTLSCDIGNQIIQTLCMADAEFAVIADWSRGLEYFDFKTTDNVYSFSDEDFRYLTNMYTVLYGTDITVSPSAVRAQSVSISGEVIGSACSRSSRSSNVMAFWPNDNGDIKVEFDVTDHPHPGTVQYFISHAVIVSGSRKEHLLARVNWYEHAPDNVKELMGTSVFLYRRKLFLTRGSSSFIPVQRIKSKFVHCPVAIGAREFVAVIARNRIGT